MRIMTAFFVGISIMVLPLVILAGIFVVLSKVDDEDSDAVIIYILGIVVTVILIYFGYGIMDKAVVELGWWTG